MIVSDGYEQECALALQSDQLPICIEVHGRLCSGPELL